MASERTASPDPARTLELLWRAHRPQPVHRGPQQRLSVDEVVAAAVRLADSDGSGAVTMRRMAERLGITTMSIYTYVPGKRELFDLMLDSLYAAMPRPSWRTRSWRKRLTAVARHNRDLIAAHPWAATAMSSSRPPLGPGLMAKYEYELSAFDGTGLDDVESDAALTFLLGFVRTSAQAAAEAQAEQAESRMSDAAWWDANAPLLAQIFDERTYPRAVRIGAAAGAAQGGAYNADRAYDFGLQRVLDGLAALIDSRAEVARLHRPRARSRRP
jgi:AcrR family transcriptional regulator